MSKKVKITEDQFNEFIDQDGAVISGDYDGSDSKIRTNYYRSNKRPQTSDDFADEAGQNSRWYYYRGFSVAESENKLNEEENMNKVTSIPEASELSKSYELPELQLNLDSITKQLTSLGANEQEEQDIKAIVLKQILSLVQVSSLTPEQQQEIKSMIK